MMLTMHGFEFVFSDAMRRYADVVDFSRALHLLAASGPSESNGSIVTTLLAVLALPTLALVAWSLGHRRRQTDRPSDSDSAPRKD